MNEVKEIGQYKVHAAKVKHSARKMSMQNALNLHLDRLAASLEVDRAILKDLHGNAALYETLTDAQREFCDAAQGLGSWVVIAACIEPFITMQQWLEISEATLDELSRVVQELNPHWFGATPEQEKKTNATPPQSTSDLAT